MTMQTLEKYIGQSLLVCALLASDITSARGEEQPSAAAKQAAKKGPEDAKRLHIDTDEPPADSAKDQIVNAAGQPMAQEGGVTTKLKVNCGIVTCSYYLSRKETRTLANNGLPVNTAVTFIPEIGPVLAAAGSVAIWKAQQAAKKNQCLRVRTIGLSGAPVGLYSDGGKFCKN